MGTYSGLFVLYYLAIYISTGLLSFSYIANNREQFFSRDAFPSFYTHKRSVITNIKLYFFLIIFSYGYSFGLFCSSLPMAIILADILDVPNNLIEVSVVVIVFAINIFFIPLLPKSYNLVVNIFSNKITDFIIQWIDKKLGLNKPEPTPAPVYTPEPVIEEESNTKPKSAQDININININNDDDKSKKTRKQIDVE